VQDTRGKVQFIVRSAEPRKHTKILLQLATNTYNAFTNWGGHSLYASHDRASVQGHRVSFDRPLESPSTNLELPFVQWAETNSDVIDDAVNSTIPTS